MAVAPTPTPTSALSKASAAASAAAAASLKAAKLARTRHRDDVTYYAWYITAGIIALFALFHAWALLSAWLIRRRMASQHQNDNATKTEAAPAAPQGSHVGRAFRAVFNNITFYRVIPMFMYRQMNAGEAFFMLFYAGLSCGLACWMSAFPGFAFDVANPFGLMAFAQIPLTVGLASKNNVISALTGIPYEKLNLMHRTAGRTLCLLVAVHVFSFVDRGLGKHGPGSEEFTTGVVAAVPLLVAFLTSFGLFRHFLYELFLITHIAMIIMFLVGAYYHWRPYGYWVWAGMVLWGLDRIVSLGKLIVVNTMWLLLPFSGYKRDSENPASESTIELLEDNHMRITVTRPLLKWNPGDHAFITMPQVALLRYERHPLTMINIPDESGKVVFLMGARNGFTGRLAKQLTSSIETNFRTYIEGPYGVVRNMNHYDSVLLVTGGTGISYGLPHLLAVMKGSQEGTSAVSRARLVWNIRKASYISWIAPVLNEAVARGYGNLDIHIDVYVTSSSASGEPTDHDGQPSDLETPVASPPISPSASQEKFGTFADLGTTGQQQQQQQQQSDSASSSGTEYEAGQTAGEKTVANRWGLSPEASRLITFHQGRSHVEKILRADVESCPQNGAGLNIGVCGPISLTLTTRRAITNVNSASAVMKGQAPISFHSESFGW